MSNEVSQLGSLQEKLTARIREQFADLIPQEMWQGLIAAETKKFMDVDLPALVKEEAKKEIAKALQEEFQKPEWRETWLGYGASSMAPGANRPSEMMTKIIKDCAPELVNALFGQVANQLVMHLRNGNYGRF